MNETPSSPASEEPASPEPETANPTSEITPTPDPAALQVAVRARNDLATKLGIRVDDITISSAQAVTWPDSSLGCPQEGMAYTQVLTPGYLILLETGGKTYEYHASRDSFVIFCENPGPPVPGMPGDV